MRLGVDSYFFPIFVPSFSGVPGNGSIAVWHGLCYAILCCVFISILYALNCAPCVAI